ncbi:MAG: phosphate signaling complex protein PhoU [Proteobacteria bacterium]|uniref:Phosphate-specific transport system accessory protein PhoU n=1 Tax=Candidatus Avisuccinivibrio stercorigallinarum TaxID=2840704 RepID=A0A9D9GUH0_9GAMM|nr:phosphate signaling complex protein PhoU [Candidatus Avisuccinivibrio stercorigallinarum]
MRTHFDAQLATLNNELILMGSLCENAIAKASQALHDHSKDMAFNVYKSDTVVDKKERDIEALCLSLILHQQPIASDLRFISAALKMITDMERIADQASDIAEITLNFDFDEAGDISLIDEMAKATIKMVNGCIDAYIKRDLKTAQDVLEHDDEVDEFFYKIKTQLVERIRAHDQDGQTSLDLLMIAKYLERIGDHACNIAQWVIFAITGNHKNEE